ncbi:MAG: hypothetical protein IKO79_10675 [Butyrivibrio sp.]|nr:hypothetical protein [Butyrivibrio sp.]
MLGIVVAAYRDFSDRVQTLVTSGLSKSECVAKLIEDLTGVWGIGASQIHELVKKDALKKQRTLF